jgi:hypothetical protein
MKNITLSVNEEVLDGVRRYATANGTSVNALVREYLGQLAGREDRAKRAVARMLRLSKQSKIKLDKITWTREDLYDR